MDHYFRAQDHAEEIVAIIDAVLDGRYAEYTQPDWLIRLNEHDGVRCYAVNVRVDSLEKCSPEDEARADPDTPEGSDA